MRLKADFWVAAYLRRLDIEGVAAVLRRRGSPEAGAVYVRLDCLDGRTALFGQAPSSEDGAIERTFMRLHKDEWLDPAESESRLAKIIRIDADIWLVEVENRSGETLLPFEKRPTERI